ncbi:MAG TPA: pyruvate kinase [Acidimicrobiales bacterium]
MPRRTKIVATLGPACDDPGVLAEMVAAGVDVVRLNLSHGTADEHLGRLRQVRTAAAEAGRVVAVLADLPGPKVRCGDFGERGHHLATGTKVRLEPGGGPCDSAVISVDYPTLGQDLNPGDVVIVGDGTITLRVETVAGGDVTAVVESGGRASGRPGFHLPAARSRLSTPTEEDLRLLATVVGAGVDFVAVSFVRSAADLDAVRRAALPASVRLVAKIETAPAVDNLDEIVAAADAVMVARGDLGIELAPEDVPHLQKRVIRQCVAAGKPVITATQMLESMIISPSPTRAEVSDVANAVFDGTDALMLSGETAIGADPAGTVATMARIAERAEAGADYEQWAALLAKRERAAAPAHPTAITRAITHAAWQAASDLGAAAILCSTRSGLTATAMARYRPTARLVGLSADDVTVRALALVWGVTPRLVPPAAKTDEMVWYAVEAAVRAGDARPGDHVVVLARSPDSPDDSTDVLRLVRVR